MCTDTKIVQIYASVPNLRFAEGLIFTLMRTIFSLANDCSWTLCLQRLTTGVGPNMQTRPSSRPSIEFCS